MTSRTRLESLTVEVDQLRRLNDAQARGDASDLKPDAYYLNPGLFWWAFRPETARTRGLPAADAKEHGVRLPYPGFERVAGKAHDAVLLIDEIDKAEPDLPNDLLEPLDRCRFDLPEGFRTKADELRRRPPGTAEFLDAVRACEDLNIDVSDAADSVWTKIENAVLVKDTRA